jgi:outer membrane protein assembly factor BamB
MLRNHFNALKSYFFKISTIVTTLLLAIYLNANPSTLLAASGDQLWRFSIANNASGFISTNTNNIFFTTTDGILYALSKSGTVSWKKTMSSASSNSILIDEFSKLLYYGTGQYLTALDFSGNTMWEKTITSHITTPFSLDYNFNIVIGTETGLTIADKTGEIVNEITLGTAAAKQPVIGTSKYFVPGQDNAIYAVTKSTGTIAWKYSRTSSISPLAIGKHQYVIFGTNNGQLAALNDSGAIVWSKQLSGAITESPVIDSAGNIVVVTNSSNIYSYSWNGTLVFSKTISYLSNKSATIDCDDNIYVSTTQGKIIRLKQDGTTDATYTTASAPITPISILNKSIIFAQNKFVTSIENDNVEPVGFWPEPRQFSTGQASFNNIEWRYNSRTVDAPTGCSYGYFAINNKEIYASGTCSDAYGSSSQMIQKITDGNYINGQRFEAKFPPYISLTSSFLFSKGDGYGAQDYINSLDLTTKYNSIINDYTYHPTNNGDTIYLITHIYRSDPWSLKAYTKAGNLWSTTLDIYPSELLTMSDGNILIYGTDQTERTYKLYTYAPADGSIIKSITLSHVDSYGSIGIKAVNNTVYHTHYNVVDNVWRWEIDSYTNNLEFIRKIQLQLHNETSYAYLQSMLAQGEDVYTIHTEQVGTSVTTYASHYKNGQFINSVAITPNIYYDSVYFDNILLTSNYLFISFYSLHIIIGYDLHNFEPAVSIRIPNHTFGPIQIIDKNRLAISANSSIFAVNIDSLGNADNSWSGLGKDNLNSRSCYIKGEQKNIFNPSLNLLLTTDDH